MLTALKGATLYVAGGIVLAIVGCATWLAHDHILTGADWLVVGSAVLAGLGIISGVHVTGTQVTSALMTPPPTTGAPAPSVGTTGGGVSSPPVEPVAPPVEKSVI